MMMETLDESIRVPGKMVMVLDPWDEAVVLRRVWCLFEVYRAIELHATVHMRFSRREQQRFYSKLKGGQRGTLYSYTILIHYTHTLYSYTILIPHTRIPHTLIPHTLYTIRIRYTLYSYTIRIRYTLYSYTIRIRYRYGECFSGADD
jgi:hypothetical protein